MLCALLWPTNTTAAEIFKSLNDYISAKPSWHFVLVVCTDGAASMSGRLSGLARRLIREVAPDRESAHCVIHREMLARRKRSAELHNILNKTEVMNLIKAHALDARLFEQLCEEMDAAHKGLLLHTEVRRLSRGRSLTRVFELPEQLQRFLPEKNSPLAAHFGDKEWAIKLCDIMSLLTELNLSLQGKMATVFKLADKIAAFKAKLELWER